MSMQRLLAVGIVVLSAACAEFSSSPASSNAADPALSAAGVNQSAAPIDIAVIGDAPYGDPAEFPPLIDAISSDAKVRLAVHVGDIKSGSTICSDEWFDLIANNFAASKDPLVYAIGDNEWTDCHRANNGGYNPLERLAKLRQVFFASPGRTLGGRNMGVRAQANYPENQLWVESRVTFVALHIVGSNNGLAPWFGGAETPAQTAAREREVADRNAANIAWMEHAFAVAQQQGSLGVVLFFQADLLSDWVPGVSGHTAFVRRLEQLAAAFGRPVLLVSGDSHDYRVDVGVPWFALYDATPPDNVTQIIVDRSIEDDANWLRLRIDPLSSEVFSWEQVTVSPALVP
jgi:hypothetical protein